MSSIHGHAVTGRVLLTCASRFNLLKGAAILGAATAALLSSSVIEGRTFPMQFPPRIPSKFSCGRVSTLVHFYANAIVKIPAEYLR